MEYQAVVLQELAVIEAFLSQNFDIVPKYGLAEQVANGLASWSALAESAPAGATALWWD